MTDGARCEKRYALFAGETYYPNGGAEDLVRMGGKPALFDSIEEPIGLVSQLPSEIDWWQILDLRTGEIAAGGELPPVASDANPLSAPVATYALFSASAIAFPAQVRARPELEDGEA